MPHGKGRRRSGQQQKRARARLHEDEPPQDRCGFAKLRDELPLLPQEEDERTASVGLPGETLALRLLRPGIDRYRCVKARQVKRLQLYETHVRRWLATLVQQRSAEWLAHTGPLRSAQVVTVTPYGSLPKQVATGRSDVDLVLVLGGTVPTREMIVRLLDGLALAMAETVSEFATALSEIPQLMDGVLPMPRTAPVVANRTSLTPPRIVLDAPVPVNITVLDEEHVGLEAVEMLQEILCEQRDVATGLPRLSDVVTLTKDMLGTQGLQSSAGGGGLSSSTVEVMALCYVLDKSAWPEASRLAFPSPAKLLLDMFEFYGHVFRPDAHRIVHESDGARVYFDLRTADDPDVPLLVPALTKPGRGPVLLRSPSADAWESAIRPFFRQLSRCMRVAEPWPPGMADLFERPDERAATEGG